MLGFGGMLSFEVNGDFDKTKQFMDTLKVNDNNIVTTYYYEPTTTWIDHIPAAVLGDNSVRDSILQIKAIKFAIIPGQLGAQNGVDDTDSLISSPTDSADSDGGVVTFRVRIR